MSRLLLPLMLCTVLGMATLDARAAGEVTLVSATQVRPGEVLARVSHTGTDPLRAQDLALRLDGGREVPAATLTAAPAAAGALLLCLDRSGSMGPAVAAMQGALRETLVSDSGGGTLPFSVAITAFGTRTVRLLGLTNDASRVASALGRLQVERERDGKTLLHEAMAGGLTELRTAEAPVKRLLVVSDGNDEGSSMSQKTVLSRAVAAPSIPIDAVGFGPRAASSSGSLSTLAEASGGRFAVAGTQAELAATLKRMVRQASTPGAQFDVTFRYAAAPGGRPAEAPVLLWRPAGAAPSQLPVRASLVALAGAAVAESASAAASAAPAASAAAKAPAEVPAPVASSASGGLSGLIAGSPALAWLLGGLLLAVLLLLIVLLLRKRRQPEVLPEPAPAPPSRTVGPTVVSAPPTVAPPPPATAPPRGRRETLMAWRWPLPGEGRTVAVLRVVSGTGRGRRLAVTRSKVSLGSATDNDLMLEGDDFVSGHHAVVRAEAGNLYLVDVGSSNGTELHGVRFKDGTRALSPGDHFTLGRTVLEVTAADAPQQPGGPGFEQGVR